jgi:hypothetical protein
MTLLDHFHPPLRTVRQWHSFHHAWATYIASELNRLLPEGYAAEPNIWFGVEIDVAAFEHDAPGEGLPDSFSRWDGPPPAQTIPLTLIEDVAEVRILGPDSPLLLAGAIELVSPSNKDRPESRDAFVSKCAAYVQQTVGLMIVDVVTERHADLHNELMDRLGTPAESEASPLYAASYRPTRIEGENHLEVWREGLAVGQPLPRLPLWLRGSICIGLDLDATYTRTCRELRIPPHGA